MKIVKYYKDNCPGCEQLAILSVAEGYVFDETIHVIKDLDKDERRKLKIMAAPTVILFDDEGKEVDRFSGMNPIKLGFFFSKRLA